MRRGIGGMILLASLLGVGAVGITAHPSGELPPPVADAHATSAHVFVEDAFTSDERAAIVDDVDGLTAKVETAFGRGFEPAPRIFIYATAASFTRGVGTRLEYSDATARYVGATYGGIFDRGSLTIVMNWSSAPADRIAAALTHELVHLMLDEATDGAPLPTWFDEGMATVFEEDFAPGTSWSIDEVVSGRALAGTGRVTLSDVALLGQWQDAYARFGRPLYTFAAETVRDIEVRVAWDGVSRLVRAVRDGTPFELAYQLEANETIAQLETRLRAGATPTIVVDEAADADGDHRWTMYTGRARGTVLVSIARPLTGYLVTFTVTTDDLGLYRGSFGSTVSPGAYTISADGIDAVVVTTP